MWYHIFMKKVPIHVLKKHLSALIDEAAAGEHIIVLRYNKPVACLVSSELRHAHIGRDFGAARLRPALKRATKNRYLDVLREDRSSEEPRG